MQIPKITKIISTTLCAMLLIGLTACKDGVTEPTYPIIIPYEVYCFSCNWTPCYWKNLTWGYENFGGTLVVINSNEELENYIECATGYNYPEIDFSKYSLILVNGSCSNSCAIQKCLLQQISINEYKLNIEIRSSNTDEEGRWVAGLIVDKLHENVNIELNVPFGGKK